MKEKLFIITTFILTSPLLLFDVLWREYRIMLRQFREEIMKEKETYSNSLTPTVFYDWKPELFIKR